MPKPKKQVVDETQEQAQEEVQEEAQAPEHLSLEDGVRECSALLVDAPDALDFSVKRTEAGRHYQSFDNQSEEADAVRKKIAKILREVYDGGMYSYGQFATPLRVEGISIMALLDEEFREQNGLV